MYRNFSKVAIEICKETKNFNIVLVKYNLSNLKKDYANLADILR